MKKIISVILLSSISLLQAKEGSKIDSDQQIKTEFEQPDFGRLKTKADYLLKEDDGTVAFRGKYTIGDGAKITRYDIYNESTKELIQTDIPVYDNAGKVAMIKSYNAKGELKVIVVTVEGGHVYISPKGLSLTQLEGMKLVNPMFKTNKETK